MTRIAVIHDTHIVGYDIAIWMLRDLGYRVYLAGVSFKDIFLNFAHVKYPRGKEFLTHKAGTDRFDGAIELNEMPRDALFIDTYPENAAALRKWGWKGPILLHWILPVGPSYVCEGKFRPVSRLGVLAFNAAIAQEIRIRNLCPVEFILPPYHEVSRFSLRESFKSPLITAVNKLVDWVDQDGLALLARLRDHPDVQLELYGESPPIWARPVDHPDLVRRLSQAMALFHAKRTDTPGYVWMEAALQGVPIIFFNRFRDSTGFSFLEHGKTCLLVDNEEDIWDAISKLRDPACNRSIGYALGKKLRRLCSWKGNRDRVESLLQAIYQQYD
jgi:hypothetical protein